jgi:hypothetical protein
MPSNRTLIVVRLNGPRTTEAPDHTAYAGIEGHDVLTLAPSDTEPQPLGLYAPPNHWQRCRDYALYAARAARPDYAHYWLIDGETCINAASPADLLIALARVEADLMAPRFGARPASWGWGAHLRARGLTVHGCALPMVRLSGGALDTLLAARRAHTAEPGLASPQAWPADEAFVPTMLVKAGLRALDLNQATKTPCYTEETLGGALVHDRRQLAAHAPDGLIYHPARDLERWIQEVEQAVIAASGRQRSLADPAGVRTQAGAGLLDRLGHSCLRHPVFQQNALVPLMLAESLWRTRPWQAEPSPMPGRDRVCRLNLDRRFGGAPPVASAHLAWSPLPKNSLVFVKPTDFETGDAFDLAHLPTACALPYAFDLPARQMLMTLHASLAGVLDHPFLYGAQRDMTRVIARVPVENLPLIYGAPDPGFAPVLVFSIGRTGSTLFKKLIECVTPRAFSEPDTLTQLAESPHTRMLSPDELSAMLYYAVAPLARVRLPGGADGRCVVKLRSQANGITREVARALPGAKYVFMLRDHIAWARSTFRSFGMSPANVANRLVQALFALKRLMDAHVDLTVVFYEDIVADPHATVARLTGADPDADSALAARIDAVAAADSQRGSGISRARTSQKPEGEDAWMAAFEAEWAERRPARLITKLKLRY